MASTRPRPGSASRASASSSSPSRAPTAVADAAAWRPEASNRNGSPARTSTSSPRRGQNLPPVVEQMVLHVPPDVPELGSEQAGSVLRVTGHFNDPRSTECVIAAGEGAEVPANDLAAEWYCRLGFVVESWRRSGPIRLAGRLPVRAQDPPAVAGRKPASRSGSASLDSATGPRSTRSIRSSRSGPLAATSAGAPSPRARGFRDRVRRRQRDQASAAALDVQRCRRHPPARRARRPRAAAAAARPRRRRGQGSGGAVRLRGIGGRQHRSAVRSPVLRRRACRSRSTAPGRANCAAPRPSTK